MEKLGILIVENDSTSAKFIKETFNEYGFNIAGSTRSYSGAMKILSTIKPDVALIDIELSGKRSGIDLGLLILKEFSFPFIFMSDYQSTKNIDSSILNLSDAHLIKPFKEKDLLISIENALSNFTKKKPIINQKSERNTIVPNDSIFIKKDSFYTKVKIDSILYIKSEGNYLEIITNDHKKFLIRSSFKHFLNYLPDKSFLRIHNSFVVNINYITKINHLNLFVNEYMIPISRNRKNEILKRMSFFS